MGKVLHILLALAFMLTFSGCAGLKVYIFNTDIKELFPGDEQIESFMSDKYKEIGGRVEDHIEHGDPNLIGAKMTF